MRIPSIVRTLAVLALASTCLGGQGETVPRNEGHHGFWKAELRVVELSVGDQVLTTEYDYNVYQDGHEIVRRELT